MAHGASPVFLKLLLDKPINSEFLQFLMIPWQLILH
jgi:hypothetical protein